MVCSSIIIRIYAIWDNIQIWKCSLRYCAVIDLGRSRSTRRAIGPSEVTGGSLLNCGNSIMCDSCYSSEDAIMTACLIFCTGYNLQGFGDGAARAPCVRGDCGLACQLWDSFKQLIAPQNFSQSEGSRWGPSLGPVLLIFLPARFTKACRWSVLETHLSVKFSWNCPVIPKITWGWIAGQADSSR